MIGRTDMQTRFAEVTAEILAEHLIHNVKALRSCCAAGASLCAPLKANAYGHGLEVVAPVLQRAGVDCAAVANLDEAIALRGAGWARPVLVLGAVLSHQRESERRDRLAAVLDHDLTLTLTDESGLPETKAAADAAGRTVAVHVKLDTGMGRLGACPQVAMRTVHALREYPSVRLTGVYSHFGSADLADRELADHQLATFREFLDLAAPTLPAGVTRHLANTAATIERADAHFDMVRPGIGLYGYVPAERMAARLDLWPCMRVTSRVTLVKELPPDHCVGYACTFKTKRPTRLGLVPIGYHDGYLRALSNRAVVGTTTGDAPVIGRVSMDHLAIDLTDLPAINAGDPVILVDERPDRPNSVPSLARMLGTIPYEVTCLIGPRVRRTVI